MSAKTTTELKPLMVKLYTITYPIKFPAKGEIADESTAIGYTISFELWDLIRRMIWFAHPRPRGWKVADMVKVTEEDVDKIYKLKDGGAVKPPDGWEEELGEEVWITANLMARVDAAKVYFIGYEKIPDTDLEDPYEFGYTAKKYILDKIKLVFGPLDTTLEPDEPGFSDKWIYGIILAENEDEIQKWQDDDGGCVYPFKDSDGKVDSQGWITKRLYHTYVMSEKNSQGRSTAFIPEIMKKVWVTMKGLVE